MRVVFEWEVEEVDKLVHTLNAEMLLHMHMHEVDLSTRTEVSSSCKPEHLARSQTHQTKADPAVRSGFKLQTSSETP